MSPQTDLPNGAVTPSLNLRRDLPGPLLRRGPRPLLLHLMLAQMKSPDCGAGWPDWSNVWRNWNPVPNRPPPRAADAEAQTGPDGDSWPSPDPAALALFPQPDAALVAGIAAYRRHDSRRVLSDPPVIWQEGEARLLDYGGKGRPVLFIPSLINRGYILDLAPRHSLLRFLAGHGVRPMLLDWGWPGPVERQYGLTDYIAGPLERAVGAVGQKLTLAGYCMGGLLAVAAAQRRPDLIERLALLATPWDFRAHDAGQADLLAQTLPLLQPILDASSTLPIDVLQSVFAMLDPGAVAEKFRRFGRLPSSGARARLFVAIEDWVNDGVPLAAPVARECFSGWYGRNTPMLGEWRVAGMPVDPRSLEMPCFIALPGTDRIVPPQSAAPLAQLIRGARVVEPAAGHVSMVVGASAETALWRPLLDWLR